MAFSIDYDLTGTGWGSCTCRAADSEFNFGFSYLEDGLQRLVMGTAAILSEARNVSFSFAQEPGEIRWSIERRMDDTVDIVIRHLDDHFEDRPDADGEICFAASCPVLEFGRVVEASARRVVEMHGLEGYRGMWIEQPFPLLQLDLLEWIVRARTEKLQARDFIERAHPCPCCGYLVFENGPRFGEEICPYCFWSSDAMGLRFPDIAVGPNHVSLLQAQARFREVGASEEGVRRFVHAIPYAAKRDPEWRPIDETSDSFESLADTGSLPYPEDDQQLYYWRSWFWRSATDRT